MGLPIKKIKDSAKSFPIKPLTIYVLDGLRDRRRPGIQTLRLDERQYQFEELVNNPPYSLLPIEYKFLKREVPLPDPNSILNRLGDYDIVTRDVEIEEHYDPSTLPSDFAVEYICGKIPWNLSFGLSMGLSILTHELITDIKTTAEKILSYYNFLPLDTKYPIDLNYFDRIITLTNQSLEILHKSKSIHNLKASIEDLRDWLDKTSIMRKVDSGYTEDAIDSSFEKGKLQHSDFGIIIKRATSSYNPSSPRDNRYQINLRIADRLFPIKSSEQSIFLYFATIVFAYNGETFPRKLLLINPNSPTPDNRRSLYPLFCCYKALKGGRNLQNLLSSLDKDSLHEILDQDETTGDILNKVQFDRLFLQFYERLSVDTNGEFDLHRIINLMSRVNRKIIPFALQEYPPEVWEIFNLGYDQNTECYSLNIPPENITIE